MKKKVWLIGAGGMALDYIKVLDKVEANLTVISRGEEAAKKCGDASGHEVISGGVEKYLLTEPELCSHAIVAVGVENLFKVTKVLLENNVKNILVEKPGALLIEEFNEMIKLANEKKANVFIAYNRRFYAAVIEAQKLIEQDGGVESFNFEFTEWSHKIENLKKADGVLEKWFLGNSTHVVDLAFFLGGKPKKIASFFNGSLSWHPTASNFSGAGISEKGALFSYHANWESAGRWAVEVLTKKNKFIFKPMEKLQIQSRGKIAQEFADINYQVDEEFKPGLFVQTSNFLNNDFEGFCSLEEQGGVLNIYNKMANYKANETDFNE